MKANKLSETLMERKALKLINMPKKCSFTYSDRLSFQVQIEKKQTPFTETKLYTEHTPVFTF